MKAYVGCVGCEQRQLDSERVRAYLQTNGFALVNDASASDFVILITCAVDESNERASVESLRNLAASKGPRTRFIVGGCLPSISPQHLEGFGVTGIFSPRSMERLDMLIGVNVGVPMRYIADPNRSIYDGNFVPSRHDASVRNEYDQAKRGFKIRINHGCLMKCSYCVIVNATGRLESVSMEHILYAFKRAVHLGEPSIMLLGGDTGAYGIDFGTNFSVLLKELLTIDGTHRVYIHDFNVNWLLRDMSDYLAVLKSGSERLRAMCLPVQSGSDTILGRMRRPYRATDVIRAIQSLRQYAGHIAIGTHIIVGFPGETEKDFELSLALLRDVQFDFVTCFRYSEHPKAPSFHMGPKVTEEQKASRMDLLRDLLRDRGTFVT